jgi:hypothetical protein
MNIGNMPIVSIKGTPRYLSKREVRHVINWMARSLKLDRYNTPLYIDVVYTKNLLKRTDYGGFCIWQDSNHRPRDFFIEADASRSKIATIQTLIHEMIHVWQFATGRMKDLVWEDGYDLKRWKDQRIESEDVDYWDLPWEQEAYAYERRYWMDYKRKNHI